MLFCQVRIDPVATFRSDEDTDMNSDREGRDRHTSTLIDSKPRTHPLEAKSLPPQLVQFMEQIAGQLDILTQVSH